MSHGHQTAAPGPEAVTVPPGHILGRLHIIGIVAAALGLAGVLVLGRAEPKQFFFSYLVAFAFFLSLGLGGMFFVLVQFATRSGWSVVVRRVAENLMGTLPLFVVLFIPLALGLHSLFHWSHAGEVARDRLLQGKQPYLNEGFFFARAAAYLAVWTVIAMFFRRMSARQDRTGDKQITRKLQAAAGPMLVLFALSLTFASFDWLMSLDPHWFSTIFGVYYFSGSAVAVYATLTLLLVLLDRAGLLAGAVTVEHYHDLGKMMFAFVCFWAYIAFSQYFLIWYANIPEETIWFLHRWEGSWSTTSLLLGLGHFVVPFFYLLPRTVKRSRPLLTLGAAWMLFIHYVDIYWMAMPVLHHHGVQLHLLDAACLLLVGGVFLAGFGWQLRRSTLIPLGDPRLPESLQFENV